MPNLSEKPNSEPHNDPLIDHSQGFEVSIEEKMAPTKRYVLRLFLSIKYITANVIDRNNGRIVATSSSVEHALKGAFECGRTSNAKAAAVVGEVLAMRLKVHGIGVAGGDDGSQIHADVRKEIEKKGLKSSTKVWALVKALRDHGVKLVLDDRPDNPPPPPSF